jgi:RecA-family ATPase
VIVDPTHKLLGTADENSATHIAVLLAAMESLAVTTGAAVAMASHFAKGNASAKESIDR